MDLADASILVTGGTGSFGTKFVEVLLARHRPRRLVVFSRDELKQSQMQARLSHRALRFFIGDVRDKERLVRAMHDIDVVVHAAALKQILACEYNPFEAIQTNVIGAKNVIDAAIDCRVKRVIAISTDKACVDWHAGVSLADGSTLPISRIARQKLPVRVRTIRDNKVSDAEVTGWYKNKRLGRRMLHLSYEGAPRQGRHQVGVWLTEDHPILTVSGWKKAGDVGSDDELLVAEPWPNPRQFGFLVGTLLGDASLGRNRSERSRYRLRFSHVSTDFEWFQVKLQALNGFHRGKPGRGPVKRGRRGQIAANFRPCPAFQWLGEAFYSGGRKKAVPRAFVEEALRAASVEFLAAWFLDDGCRVPNNPGTDRSQARLATHGFTEEDVTWLAGCLTRHGFPCSARRAVVDRKTYWEIRFPTETAERLFSLIGRAVPPSLRRKVSDSAPPYDPSFWDLGEPKLTRARPQWLSGPEPRRRDVYCLGVNETQNFIVNGLVLHNCQPVNLYGATKLCAEKLFVQGNAYGFPRGTLFACVRYGNVIGSRGSVIPLFESQRANGTVTVTDPGMTRFWIRLEQGVEFVIRCIGLMRGGEIFVPKLPSMRMMDLVEAAAPGCGIELIGIRPGEKLHEMLISEDEARQAMEFDDMFVIEPAYPSWSYKAWDGGQPIPAGFRYASDTNSHVLTPEEMRTLVDG